MHSFLNNKDIKAAKTCLYICSIIEEKDIMCVYTVGGL